MLTAFLIITVVSVAVYLLLKLQFKKGKNLPPGPTQWPIVGNIFELASANSKYPHLAMVKLAEKYGDVMSVRLGVHNACIVTSYEACKEIFIKEESYGRYTFPFVTDRAFHKTLGIIWSNGSMWREMRRYTTKGLREFGFGKLKSMDSSIQEEVSDMITFLKLTSEENNEVVDIDPHIFAGSVINILWSMVAGYKFPIGDETIHKILEHGANVNESTSQNNIYNAFPKLRYWFPKLTKWDIHMNTHKTYQEFVKGMITKAREQRANRQSDEADNFIEIFLDEIDRNKNNPSSYFTEEQLIVILQDLFLAGSETTGTAMSWALLHIVLNPKVQVKLKEEIKKIVPEGETIQIADFKRMPFLRATLYEIFRISGIAPIPPPRKTEADIYYNGYKIPKDTLLISNLHNILNDKSYWIDPEVFRPERFLDETGTKVINTERVVVFGFGKRICLGESLVWDAMSMYLAQILKTFTIEAIKGKEPTAENPHSAGTQTPQRYSLIMKLNNNN